MTASGTAQGQPLALEGWTSQPLDMGKPLEHWPRPKSHRALVGRLSPARHCKTPSSAPHLGEELLTAICYLMKDQCWCDGYL